VVSTAAGDSTGGGRERSAPVEPSRIRASSSSYGSFARGSTPGVALPSLTSARGACARDLIGCGSVPDAISGVGI